MLNLQRGELHNPVLRLGKADDEKSYGFRSMGSPGMPRNSKFSEDALPIFNSPAPTRLKYVSPMAKLDHFMSFMNDDLNEKSPTLQERSGSVIDNSDLNVPIYMSI